MNSDDTPGSIYSAPESETSTAGTDDLLAVYVGPRRAEYYKARFEKLAGGGSIGWHWPAFFFTSAWLLYRKMWLYALLYIFVVPFTLGMILGIAGALIDPDTAVAFYYGVYFVYAFLLMPMFANRLYYGHVKSKVDKISSLNMSEGQVVQELARKGGTSWLGFIFIIIPIIGILAAIAIPAYQDYTARAQVSQGMVPASAVRAAVSEFYYDNGRFPANNAEAGLNEPGSISGDFVESVTVQDGDIIVLYGGPKVNWAITGKTLVYRPDVTDDAQLSWRCLYGDLEAKYVPYGCREQQQ